mmetsp:Transcript_17942/g.45484  ORF Transcript_17942/g.45484 Transcript_17942/m.45484 type:complete len:88 (-) Transcript_17942:192-455(-)
MPPLKGLGLQPINAFFKASPLKPHSDPLTTEVPNADRRAKSSAEESAPSLSSPAGDCPTTKDSTGALLALHRKNLKKCTSIGQRGKD